MQVWNEFDNFAKKKVDVVPTWIQVKGLELKYWGQRSLFKIVQQIGEPIQLDEATRNRSKLMYPRVLVEVRMNQEFPTDLMFINEFGLEVMLGIHYEWIPITCKNCAGLGHQADECRNKATVKQKWVPKKQPVVDSDGFQEVTKGKKLNKTEATKVPTQVAVCTSFLSLVDVELDGVEEQFKERLGEPSTSKG